VSDTGLPVAVLRLDRGLPLPSYAHPGDAGADLMTTVDVSLSPGERALVPTGISIALPEGYVALVQPTLGPGRPPRTVHREHARHHRRGLPG
jgi:dUTP pyrophosphatase